MIITTITIISLTIGVATGLISGSALGYALGRRERIDREMDEDFLNIVYYYPENVDDDNIY